MISLGPPCTNLLFIPHRAAAADHDFTPRLLLQLLGCHAAGPKYSTHKIKLKIRELEASQTYLFLVPHGALAADHHFAAGLLLQLLGGQPPRA